MQGTPELAAAFLAHTKVRLVPAPDAAELARLLTRVWEDARANWPTVALGPGLFFFESDDMIRLVRTAPYESAPLGPNQRPCRVLEIKKVR